MATDQDKTHKTQCQGRPCIGCGGHARRACAPLMPWRNALWNTTVYSQIQQWIRILSILSRQPCRHSITRTKIWLITSTHPVTPKHVEQSQTPRCTVWPRNAKDKAHLEAVSNEIWVAEAPSEGPRLGNADETRQVEHFALQVLAVLEAGKVEQLCAVRHFLLKPAQRTAEHCNCSLDIVNVLY